MNKPFEVAGSVALVTGANRGIGKAIVEKLVAEGAGKVYAAVRSLDTAEPLRQQLGERVVPLPLDLDDKAAFGKAAAAAADVQLLINNAASLSNTSPSSPELVANLAAELDTNVLGLARMAQAFMPVLERNGGGAFVQLNSIVSMLPVSEQATYATVKAATYALTVALRKDQPDQGTAVLSVHPGPTESDMATAAGYGDMAESAEDCAAAIIAALRAGETHVFTGKIGAGIGEEHRAFRESVIEPHVLEVLPRWY